MGSECQADSAIFVRLLGTSHLEGRNGRLRGRSSEMLVWYLSLRPGQSISRRELAEELWPDGDPERQDQNLRKAVSDVRSVFELDPSEPALFRSSHGQIWLEPGELTIDVTQFIAATDGGVAPAERVASLRKAIDLYKGPLLPSCQEPWLTIRRAELEQRFSQAVDELIILLLAQGRSAEALTIGRQALAAAPLREDIHISLMRAYSAAGLHAEMIRQFEELENLLAENWGETPSDRAVEVLNATRTPSAQAPSGRVDFYIERECDLIAHRALKSEESVLLIKGPRQVGKTSLLGKLLLRANSEGSKVAVADFQVFNSSQLTSTESFYKSLSASLVTQLGGKEKVEIPWQDWLGPNGNLDAVVESVLSNHSGQVVWALDEVDRIFGMEYSDDFFGLVRSWHNRRILQASGPWSRLSVVLCFATEASLFIKNIHQSPFNVGVRVDVKDFTLQETTRLTAIYGLPESIATRLFDLLSGHPYLTRRMLDMLVQGSCRAETMEQEALSPDSPLRDHLSRLAYALSQDQQVAEAVTQILAGGQPENGRLKTRIVAGGAGRMGPDGLRFRNRLYQQYLKLTWDEFRGP